MFWVPLYIFPEVGSLGQKAGPFLTFGGNSILISTAAAPICIPTNSAKGFPFLHILIGPSCLIICITLSLRSKHFWTVPLPSSKAFVSQIKWELCMSFKRFYLVGIVFWMFHLKLIFWILCSSPLNSPVVPECDFPVVLPGPFICASPKAVQHPFTSLLEDLPLEWLDIYFL